MAYEGTEVSVTKSQEQIRKLIALRSSAEGARLAIVSDPPKEGFSAAVVIDKKTYNVRIMATRKPLPTQRKHYRSSLEVQQRDWREREERRIWRVLFHHLKSVFEAADSGVMEFRELMMPYIVMPNGHTIAENILPQLDAKLAGRPDRLLESAPEEESHEYV